MTTVQSEPSTVLAVTDLASQVSGPVYVPGDDGFDAEIAAWNLATAHRPSSPSARSPPRSAACTSTPPDSTRWPSIRPPAPPASAPA